MPLRVYELSPQDPSHIALFPAIAEVHIAAWLSNTLYSQVYYGPPSSHPAIIQASQQRQLEAFTSSSRSHFAVVIDDDIKTTSTNKENSGDQIQPCQVIAFVKYDVFATVEAVNERRDTGKRTWPPYTNIALVTSFWGDIVKTRQRFSKQIGPHVNVDLLGTSPSHHRRGAGRLLMQHVVDRMDELGLKGTLEGSPQGLPLYSSMGFEPVDDVWVDLLRFDGGGDNGEEWVKAEGRVPGQGKGWYKHVAMVRQPRSP